MSNRIVPIADLGDRPPEQGRLRMGEQYVTAKGKTAMRSLSTWRLTSADEAAIRSVADRYGGTVTAWSNPKANPQQQFQVTTASSELRVFLPRDSISTWYEQWGGGGCIRRCDGVTVEIAGRDDMQTAPCICDAKKALECKPYTRLSVILPDIKPFGGVWRLETKGWNAAHEMPQMAKIIEQLQATGMVEAKLVLAKETDIKNGKRRHWVEPRLVVDESAEALMAGAARAQALPAADVAGELPAATEPEQDEVGPSVPEEDWFDKDDEIVDAEIVEEGNAPPQGSGSNDEETSSPAGTGLTPEVPGRNPSSTPPETGRPETVAPGALKKINAMVTEVAILLYKPKKPSAAQKDTIRHAIAWYASKKATESTRQLSSEAVDKAIDTLERCKTQHAWLRKLLEKYETRPF